MLHAEFASLLPSNQKRLIESAVRDLAFPARLVSFTSGTWKAYTYATVELLDRAEFVTWLVCPQNVSDGRGVYFDSGRYGYWHERDALSDMFQRAS